MGRKTSDVLSKRKGEESSNNDESEDEAFKPQRASIRSKQKHSSIASQSACKGSFESRPKDLMESGRSTKIPHARVDTTSGASQTIRKKKSNRTEEKDLHSSENSQRPLKEVDETISTLDPSTVPRKKRRNKSAAVKNKEISEQTDRKLCDTDDSSSNAGSLHMSEFCPICQVPLNVLKISAAVHTASCAVPGDSAACPAGSACLNSNMFHYRDFTHHELAAFRISEDYIEPNVVFTPQKSKFKRTPKTTSAGKKRPSKSPLASSAKFLKKDESSCSKDLPPTSPDMFIEGNCSDGTRKRLFSEDLIDIETNDDCKDSNLTPTAIVQSNLDPCVETQEDKMEENSENINTLLQSELWCSDLILSGETPQQEIGVHSDNGTPALIIKSEPKLQNSLEENCVMPTASSAKVTIHYDNTLGENEQELVRNQIQCPDSCRLSSESQDVLQANCSVLIKATGLNREEAMARSPLSVTLMINSSGWEGLEIKGNPSTNVHKLEISVCQCTHSMCVECCVNNSDILKDVKINLQDEQEEKFFSTLGDMGLKKQKLLVQPFNNNASERKKLLFKENNLITVSSAVENKSSPSWISNEDENERNDKSAVPKESVRVMNAFTLLKQKGISERPAPTPVPMVVSKSTGSSWTLVAATDTPDVAGGRTYSSVNKKVPAYKRIPDTPFVVDAFNYGVIPGAKVYFLSHFHSDHYMGLKKNFNFPIFCSQVTANLVHLKIRVDKQYLHILKVGEPRVICGVEIEVYDANHCPGAVMILFRMLDGRKFLHVGDFRAHPSMEVHSELRNVDKLYLDTTYCDPAYDFPYQEEVVQKVVETVRDHLIKNKSTLIVCGSYTIGKEKVFMGIAEAFNFKVWTTGEKKKVLQCLEDRNLADYLTSDPFTAQIHVLAMKDIALPELFQHLNKYNRKYSHIVGFKPTGWTTSTSIKGKVSDFQKSSRDKVTIYGVPYSEHSSFSELRRFVRFIRPKDIQVTVNLGKSAQYKKLFQQWLSSNRDTDGQSKVEQYFTSTSRL